MTKTTHIDRWMHDAMEMLQAVTDAVLDAKDIRGASVDPSEIYLQIENPANPSADVARFRMTEETLTDGSSVFNVIIGG